VLADVIDPNGWDGLSPDDDEGHAWNGHQTCLPSDYLHETIQATLIGLNDSGGASFLHIANEIENMGIATSA
jgi:hypothetical protein